MLTNESHYLALAAAYARGVLGRPELDDEAAVAAGAAAELRMHRFKRTAGLPRVRRVIGALRGLGATQLVDIGSGRGAFLWPLLDEMPEAEVTAIDVLPYRVADIDAVRRGGIERVRALEMDACALALTDRSADAVTMLEVLEHMPEPARAIGEAVRVARLAVIASVPSHEDNNPEHLHLFDPRTLEQLFRAAGARRVTTEHVLGHIVCIAMVAAKPDDAR
jgi:2-polyprenyl-3-methyl-5-hydroxy-6-metoxy-1,4-benzoquinol methylase